MERSEVVDISKMVSVDQGHCKGLPERGPVALYSCDLQYPIEVDSNRAPRCFREMGKLKESDTCSCTHGEPGEGEIKQNAPSSQGCGRGRVIC